MKPRYDEMSKEAQLMMKKANDIIEQIDTLEKAKMCPCGSGKPMASCCPNMKKSSYSMEPQNIAFDIETGGQTRNMFYTTNQSHLESTDVANKGATKTSADMDALGRAMNTQDVNDHTAGSE